MIREIQFPPDWEDYYRMHSLLFLMRNLKMVSAGEFLRLLKAQLPSNEW